MPKDKPVCRLNISGTSVKQSLTLRIYIPSQLVHHEKFTFTTGEYWGSIQNGNLVISKTEPTLTEDFEHSEDLYDKDYGDMRGY